MRSSKPFLIAALLTLPQSAVADEFTCGALVNSVGPFDYRIPRAELNTVEAFHFTPEVAMLKEGKSGYLGGDLDFTLRAFPNHSRALASMMELQFKAKTVHPYGAKWSVPCYFDRAIRFAPDDGTVRNVYGVYFMRLGKPHDAIEQFELAVRLGDDSGNLHYNLGLAYFDVHDYDKAVAEAQKAYALGFSLPGLQEKLRRAGKWPSS